MLAVVVVMALGHVAAGVASASIVAASSQSDVRLSGHHDLRAASSHVISRKVA
jgi:hypothetical protein